MGIRDSIRHSIRRRVLLALGLTAGLHAWGQTLAECQQAAERNYPLIRQYDLIAKTTDLTVRNIQKGWLPQLQATAQATLQSDVTAWPGEMQTMLSGLGLDVKGLKKDQYRVGLDVSQTVFDGGLISSQKQVARVQGEVQAAQTEVTLYQVRQRVNELYFGVLLLDENLRLNSDLQTLLEANERRLASMLKNGTAMESDYHAVKAERLSAVQQATNLTAQRQTLVQVLATLCGIDITGLVKPAPTATGGEVRRPELRAIEARLRLADAQEKTLDAALLPKLGVFAQGFYGYPGYNMFEDMFSHKWSLNGMIGARLSWNIGALYTRRNDKAKLSLQRDATRVERDAFLLNNRLEEVRQTESIDRYRRLMADDEDIIGLRESVRRASESKLQHGIISVSDLVRDINAENAARVQHSLHEIEMLKEQYDLKFTTGD